MIKSISLIFQRTKTLTDILKVSERTTCFYKCMDGCFTHKKIIKKRKNAKNKIQPCIFNLKITVRVGVKNK